MTRFISKKIILTLAVKIWLYRLILRNDLIGKRIPNIKVGSNAEQYIDELSDYINSL